MGAVNYITPVDSLTLTDQKEYRMRAVAAGVARSFDKRIGNPLDIPGFNETPKALKTSFVLTYLKAGGVFPPSIDVREFQPALDAGAAVAVDDWQTPVLAVVNVFYSCFGAVPAPVLAANKLAVFFKVGVETAPMNVSRLLFRSGGAVGNILAVFDLEQLINSLRTEGYFSEPVVIDPTIVFAAQVRCRVASGLIERVQLGGLVFEPAGQTTA